MKIGPRPSDANVEDGDDTHSLRNRPLPTLKPSSPSKSMLPDGSEKASESDLTRTVAAPAGSPSNLCRTSNEAGGAVADAILCLSASVLGMMFRCGSSSGPAGTAGPMIIRNSGNDDCRVRRSKRAAMSPKSDTDRALMQRAIQAGRW